MGADASRELPGAGLEIPNSLRAVLPFLQLATRFVGYAYRPDKIDNLLNIKKMAVAAVNRTFKMVGILNIELDHEARICLENFRKVRDRFNLDLSASQQRTNNNCEYDPALMDRASRELRDRLGRLDPHSSDILIAEADEVLCLAEELREARFTSLAAEQYHTAAVYYRVMESRFKTHNAELRQRLEYAADRARQGAPLAENIPGEYFTNKSCSDVYDINGRERLGRGSYGSVYPAVHRITGDLRAVKVMNVDKVTSYYLRKLHSEITILRSLDHPNIISLQDVFYGRRSVYLVTQLCRGGELFELLNTGKSRGFVFKEDRAALLVRDMLSAVHYLHSKQIVHRDLKLENFLFEQQSSESPLILIDFGLARRFEIGERMSQRVGSCYYTAPEVLLGDYDHTCDVWSVGVLLYMLLSGSPPFAGQSPEEVYHNIGTTDVVYSEKRFGRMSPTCMDFLRRLLVRDPRKRMTTAEALAHPYIAFYCQLHWSPHQSNSHHLQQQLQSFQSQQQQLVPQQLQRLFTAPPRSGGCLRQSQMDKIVHSIWLFLSFDPLTRLVLQIAAHSLAPELTFVQRAEFYAMDLSHSGGVTESEFVAALSNSQAVTTGQVDLRLMHRCLCMQSGKSVNELSFRAYLAASMPGRLGITGERVRMVFNTLDPKMNSCVSADGIQTFSGLSLSQQYLEEMIHTVCTKHPNYSPNSPPIRSLTIPSLLPMDVIRNHFSVSYLDVEGSCQDEGPEFTLDKQGYKSGDRFHVRNHYFSSFTRIGGSNSNDHHHVESINSSTNGNVTMMAVEVEGREGIDNYHSPTSSLQQKQTKFVSENLFFWHLLSTGICAMPIDIYQQQLQQQEQLQQQQSVQQIGSPSNPSPIVAGSPSPNSKLRSSARRLELLDPLHPSLETKQVVLEKRKSIPTSSSSYPAASHSSLNNNSNSISSVNEGFFDLNNSNSVSASVLQNTISPHHQRQRQNHFPFISGGEAVSGQQQQQQDEKMII